MKYTRERTCGVVQDRHDLYPGEASVDERLLKELDYILTHDTRAVVALTPLDE